MRLAFASTYQCLNRGENSNGEIPAKAYNWPVNELDYPETNVCAVSTRNEWTRKLNKKKVSVDVTFRGMYRQ